MSSATDIDLTTSQRHLLTALVNEFEATDSPVKAARIADEVGRTADTVRNQMQSLKALSLVDGRAGPDGGYRPTEGAYDVLDRRAGTDPETVTVAHDFDRLDVTVTEIDLTAVHDPEECRARLHLQHSVRGFEPGDPVAAGPIPASDLLIAGEVLAVDEASNELLVAVAQLEAPAEDPGDDDA